MNKPHIRQLIDKLKELKATGQEHRYNQRRVYHEWGKTTLRDSLCGTPACLAGWAFYLSGGNFEEAELAGGVNYEKIAAEWLGLKYVSTGTAHLLEGRPFGHFKKKTANPTIDDAIAVLENLLETGKVEWSLKTPTGNRLIELNYGRTDFEKYGESAL